MKLRLPLATCALALSVGLLVSACSSSGDHGGMNMGPGASHSSSEDGSTAPIPPDANFNAVDVEFAQGMIPHHSQAITMAEMVSERSESPEIERLASAIKSAQGPEIEQLTAWLEDWGQAVPDVAGMADHDMGGMGGMMSSTEMEQLERTTGDEFDRMWLQMMTVHHEGAVTMAEEELNGGKFGPAREMAEDIITSQRAEIDEMAALLAGLPD